MRCEYKAREASALAIDYTAGMLEASRAIAFERHLGDCPTCREVVQQQAEVWAALDDWSAERAPVSFDVAVLRRIGAEAPGSSAWSRLIARLEAYALWLNPGPRTVVPIAAVCALLLVIVVTRTPAIHSPSPVPASASVNIEQVESALDDIEMLNQAGVIAAAPSVPAHRSVRTM